MQPGADPAHARRRRWKRALLASALSLGLALLAAELFCRLRFGAPVRERLPLLEVRANPSRGWEMLPSREHYTYLERVEVNSLGLRGRELGPKAPGERRVLALGDSLIYGQGVGEADTVPARLERALSGFDPGWRVVNGGLRAYNTEQEVALALELWDAIEPDVIVLFWFANDTDLVDVGQMSARLERSGPVVFDLSARAEGRVLLEWRAKQILRQSALVMRLYDALKDMRSQPFAPEVVEAGFASVERSLARLTAFARERGSALVFAAIPVNTSLEPGAPRERAVERALAIAEGLDLPTLDLLPPLCALREELGYLPVIPYDGHYQPSANERIAREVALALRERFPERFAPN